MEDLIGETVEGEAAAEDTRNQAALAPSKLGASKGGKAPAEKLTAAKRRAISKRAAKARGAPPNSDRALFGQAVMTYFLTPNCSKKSNLAAGISFERGIIIGWLSSGDISTRRFAGLPTYTAK